MAQEKKMISVRIDSEVVDKVNKVKSFMKGKEGEFTLTSFVQKALEVYADSFVDYYPALKKKV